MSLVNQNNIKKKEENKSTGNYIRDIINRDLQ